MAERAAEGRISHAVWLVLRTLVILVAVRCAFQQQWELFFTCLLTLLLFLAPPFVERKLHLRLPAAMKISLLLFIFCAEVLGEIACFYVKYPLWDTMLHAVNGFLFAAFGFCLADLLSDSGPRQNSLPPVFLALAAFCFSVTVGVVWEFFEFAMDRLLMLDMQKDTVLRGFQSVALDLTQRNIPVSVRNITETVIRTADGQEYVIAGYLDVGLTDTVKDLLVNLIGAAVFSVPGCFSVRQERKNSLAAAFIPVVIRHGKRSAPPRT